MCECVSVYHRWDTNVLEPTRNCAYMGCVRVPEGVTLPSDKGRRECACRRECVGWFVCV